MMPMFNMYKQLDFTDIESAQGDSSDAHKKGVVGVPDSRERGALE